MLLAHKIALDPTLKQQRYFARAAGCARFVWNLALAEWNRRYEAGEKPNANEIKKDFNAQKYEAFPWMNNVHRDAHAQPFANLQTAFIGFFKKTSDRPTFHKKGHRDSFYVANDVLTVKGNKVRLPKIGWVRLTEPLRFKGKIMSATVSRTAQRWFISIQVEADFSKKRTGNATVGIDLGITSALTLSTGEKILAPKPLKPALKRLGRYQRKMQRQLKGGRNRQKTTMKIARIHARIANIRRDFWHKVTTRLCRENQTIAIEDLNVAGMLKNRRLSRAIVDVGFGMCKPMLQYKKNIYNNTLHEVDRFFASSKTCSRCGVVKDTLLLSERVFCCDSCGLTIDRDENAAINCKQNIPTACGNFMSAKVKEAGMVPFEADTLPLDLVQHDAHLCVH